MQTKEQKDREHGDRPGWTGDRKLPFRKWEFALGSPKRNSEMHALDETQYK
jgi:hypothetical protein